MKKHLFLFIKIIITLGLFYWFLSKINFTAVASFRHTLSLSALLLGALFVAIQFFAGVARWCLILPLFRVNQSFRTALQIYWIGMFFNACLPTGIAGDALRVQLMKSTNTSFPQLISAVFLERLIGLLVLLLTVELSIRMFKSLFGTLPFVILFEALVIAGVLGFILLSYLHRLPIHWHRFRITHMIQRLSVDTNRLWQFPIKTALMFIITILATISQVLAVYFLAQGLQIHIGLLNALALVPPVILAMSLPISIGGWGIREGAMITFFALIGVSATAAFSLSVLFGIMMFFIYLPGGLFWIFWRKEKRLTESLIASSETDFAESS